MVEKGSGWRRCGFHGQSKRARLARWEKFLASFDHSSVMVMVHDLVQKVMDGGLFVFFLFL